MNFLNRHKHLFFLVIIIGIFFWPFFLQGKIPIPADTIVGMYHPWRDVVWDGLTAGVPFKNYLITDPVRQQYIWKKLAIDQYKQLKWPLWNPYTHSGMPLLANFQTGAFYPANFLFFIFNFNLAWGIYIFMGHLLAAIFMFLFLKELNLDSIACLFGSIIFSFGGFFTAWSQWGNLVHTMAWLPLIFLAIEKLQKKITKKWFLVLTFSLVFAFFAGHPQISFYVITFSLIYIIFRKKLHLLLAFFPFLLITSVQWLPTLELILNSNRNVDIVDTLSRKDWFLPVSNLVQIFTPDFFGNPATGNYWGIWNYGEFVSFIGLIPLFFVLLTVFLIKKNSILKFFWLSFLIFISFALPTPWAKLPYLLNIPLIASSQPSRLLSLVGFCLAVLAAYGFDHFLKESLKKYLILFVPFLALFSILWLYVLKADLTISQRNLLLPSAVLVIMLLIMVLQDFVKKRNIKKIIISLLILVSFFDFYRFFTKFNPFSPQEWIFPQTKTIEFLQAQKQPFRIATEDRRIMPANFAAAYRLQTISGYDPLYLKDYARLISGQDKIVSFNRIIEPTDYESGVFDELNVSYILSLNDLNSNKLKLVATEGQTRIYENINSLPRIRLSQEGQVKNINYTPYKVSFEVNSEGSQQLILADMFYPGWQARIDGREVTIYKSKNYLRSIDIGQGSHEVIFEYQPKTFLIGKLIFFLGLIALITVLLKYPFKI